MVTSPVTVNGTRSALYSFVRFLGFLGDYSAVKRGRVGKALRTR
jgi:hypothetical protein